MSSAISETVTIQYYDRERATDPVAVMEVSITGNTDEEVLQALERLHTNAQRITGYSSTFFFLVVPASTFSLSKTAVSLFCPISFSYAMNSSGPVICNIFVSALIFCLIDLPTLSCRLITFIPRAVYQAFIYAPSQARSTHFGEFPVRYTYVDPAFDDRLASTPPNPVNWNRGRLEIQNFRYEYVTVGSTSSDKDTYSLFPLSYAEFKERQDQLLNPQQPIGPVQKKLTRLNNPSENYFLGH